MSRPRRFVGVNAEDPTGPLVQHADYLAMEERVEQLRDEVADLRERLDQETSRKVYVLGASAELRAQRDALADALIPFYLDRAKVCDDEFMTRDGGSLTEYGRVFKAAEAALRLAGRLP